MHTASDGKRYYDGLDGEQLEGETVICDWARDGKCDGIKCNHYHDKPHVYHDLDLECFVSCGHDGKDGMCVLVNGNGAGAARGV